MLTPHSITLSVNLDGDFVSRHDDRSDVDSYVRAMRVVQQRTGMTPRAVLSNHAPVHVRSEIGSLTVGRVSGIPHQQDSSRVPVPVSDCEQTLFMRRGDQCVLRTDLGDDYFVTYAALTYDIVPALVLSDDPIVMADPLRAPIGDTNALRLLELVRERELTTTEQFFAALTMPSVWQRYRGQPIAAIINPSAESARECVSFAQNFTAPNVRLKQLWDLSDAWQAALLAVSERESGLEPHQGKPSQGAPASLGSAAPTPAPRSTPAVMASKRMRM